MPRSRLPTWVVMLALALAPLPGWAEDGGPDAVVHLQVAAAAATETAARLKQLGAESRREPGAAWFEALEEVGRPDRFAIVEIWDTPQALDRHQDAAPTREAWRALEPSLVSPVDRRRQVVVAGQPPPTLTGTPAVALTHVDVNSAAKEQGLAYLNDLVARIRGSDGAVGVVLLQQDARPNHLTLVEIWRDQQALDAHASARETVQFRQRLQPLLGGLYDERRYTPVR